MYSGIYIVLNWGIGWFSGWPWSSICSSLTWSRTRGAEEVLWCWSADEFWHESSTSVAEIVIWAPDMWESAGGMVITPTLTCQRCKLESRASDVVDLAQLGRVSNWKDLSTQHSSNSLGKLGLCVLCLVLLWAFCLRFAFDAVFLCQYQV